MVDNIGEGIDGQGLGGTIDMGGGAGGSVGEWKVDRRDK